MAMEALEHISRRLQMNIDDGSRPDQWSMEDLVRKAASALSAARSVLDSPEAGEPSEEARDAAVRGAAPSHGGQQ
jgi:hypothetical protein